MTVGLKGKVREIWNKMEAERRDLRGPVDTDLQAFLSQNYNGNDGKPLTVAEFFYELDINPNVTTVDFILTQGDEDTRWIIPEIFRSAIRKGYVKAPWSRRISIGEERVAQPSQVMPYLNLSDVEPEDVEEGADLAEGTVSYGEKTVKVTKSGILLKMTYEAIQFSTLNFLSIMLEDVGVKLGLKTDRKALIVLVNGDQADGSEAAAVIGVENTTNGLTYFDETRLAVRARLIGRRYEDVIAGEQMSNFMLNIAEHKTPVQGQALVPISVSTPLPGQLSLEPEAHLPAADRRSIWVDKTRAIVQLTAVPLAIEADKLINKQIRRTAVTVTTGFANVFRDGRVIIKDDILFSGNGFPSWMDPTLSDDGALS